MLEFVQKLLAGAKRDDEVYTILRVAVRATLITTEDASTLGASLGIDYENWHGEDIPGNRG